MKFSQFVLSQNCSILDSLYIYINVRVNLFCFYYSWALLGICLEMHWIFRSVWEEKFSNNIEPSTPQYGISFHLFRPSSILSAMFCQYRSLVHFELILYYVVLKSDLISFFYMYPSSLFQHTGWRDCLFSIVYFHLLCHRLCFPGGLEGKASAYNAGDPGSIPGSGRSPGEGNGNPFQYCCQENPMDWESW